MLEDQIQWSNLLHVCLQDLPCFCLCNGAGQQWQEWIRMKFVKPFLFILLMCLATLCMLSSFLQTACHDRVKLEHEHRQIWSNLCPVTFGLEISFQSLKVEGEMHPLLIVFASTAKGATPRQCYTQKKMIFREFFYPDWRPCTCQVYLYVFICIYWYLLQNLYRSMALIPGTTSSWSLHRLERHSLWPDWRSCSPRRMPAISCLMDVLSCFLYLFVLHFQPWVILLGLSVSAAAFVKLRHFSVTPKFWNAFFYVFFYVFFIDHAGMKSNEIQIFPDCHPHPSTTANWARWRTFSSVGSSINTYQYHVQASAQW